MKVLVTGAGGFIGARVAAEMGGRGWEVVGASRLGGGGLEAADIADRDSVLALADLGQFDAVVHCAAIAHRAGNVSAEDYERINVHGTRNVAELAVRCGAAKFVHLSSVLVYGRHGSGISETDQRTPRDAYAASKLASETAAAEAGELAGLAVTILRPAPVIGEGCKGNFGRLIDAIARGRFVMVGDGSNRKSMIYVGDVARACRLAIENEGEGVRIYNVAAEPISTGELVKAVYSSLDKRMPAFRLPGSAVGTLASVFAKAFPLPPIRTAARFVDTWLSEDVYSTEAGRNGLGFEPEVKIGEAVELTVQARIARANGSI